MTPEERERIKARITELEAQRSGKRPAPASAPAPAPAQEEEPELGLIDNIRGGLQSFQRGQLFGFGDEIVGAGRALTDYGISALLDEDTGDQSFKERYRMYRDDERANQEQFADENTGLAMALELGGAIAAPIKGPRGAREAVPIPKTALGRAVNRYAPSGGYTALAGRGAAEGALYGAGTAAELSDIPDEVDKGALIGGAFGAGFRGLQGAGQQIAKQRVAQDLGEGAKQIPIWIAQKQGRLGDFYRGFLGRSFFARKAMSEQEAPFKLAAQEGVERAKRGKIVTVKALDDAAEAINDNFEATKKLIGDETNIKKGALGTERKKLLKETTDVLEDDVKNLRATAAQEAVPDNYRAEVLKDVDLEDPIAVSNKLKEFWNKDAFKMVKEREFTWDTSLPDRIRKEFSSDPELLLKMGDEPELINSIARKFGMDNAAVDDVLKKMSDWAGESGLARGDEIFFNPQVKIDGDTLMEFRNFFARQANKGGDKSRVYGLIKQRFDDMIKGQLDEVGLDAFEDQIARYTTNLTYRGATTKAKGAAGRFTPQQWLTAGGKYDDYSLGKVPLQRQADDVIGRQGEAKVLDAADKAGRSHKVMRLGQRQDAAINRATRLKKASTKQLDKKGTKQRLSDAVTKATKEKTELGKLAIPENPSGLSEWLTTSLMASLMVPGAAIGGPVGATLGLAGAAGLSKALTSKGGQRVIAGQSKLQNAMRDLSDDEKMRLVASMLRQGAGRTSTMNTVD